MKKIVIALAFCLLFATGCLKKDSFDNITIYTTAYPFRYVTEELYGKKVIINTVTSLVSEFVSIVCGFIPSSAATTIIAISVICAPLALIAVNASCPGVSKKVISLPFTFTL